MGKLVRYDPETGREIVEYPEGYGEALIEETFDPRATIEVEIRTSAEEDDSAPTRVMWTVEELRERFTYAVQRLQELRAAFEAEGSNCCDERKALIGVMEQNDAMLASWGFWMGGEE